MCKCIYCELDINNTSPVLVSGQSWHAACYDEYMRDTTREFEEMDADEFDFNLAQDHGDERFVDCYDEDCDDADMYGYDYDCASQYDDDPSPYSGN